MQMAHSAEQYSWSELFTTPVLSPAIAAIDTAIAEVRQKMKHLYYQR
jgi:hypothetical protein